MKLRSVNSVWITPRQALDDTADGQFKLVFATRIESDEAGGLRLPRLTRSPPRGAATVVTVLPEVTQIDGTRRVLRIPHGGGIWRRRVHGR